ncbi:SOS response-associated peptidase [Paenibacillus thiaminolyticus]|uniref:SOS response-associated peptidase n=1 Tax=Paenibacillus thiaminolyticus TaxID=49283 RepID=UPI0025431816|nr:SOS response-associated peptidase [Paenibacillus thiaminolyticus]WII38076.1 SOS response-associated peptidase [Paenibacillus thiaminolyticus]
MCRRFSLTADLPDIIEQFEVDKVMIHYRHRYNISPTQTVPVVLQRNGVRILDEYRWGMVPFWGKDSLNADIYSVQGNPAYWKVVERQRCIIPCSGFYYWRREGKKSFPVRTVLGGKDVFGVAGLYEQWKDAKGQAHSTCTIVMTRANDLVAEFDGRMPAILEREAIGAWLDPAVTEVEALARLLVPYDPAGMTAYPVTVLVNNDEYDTSDCIKEATDLKYAYVKP